MFNPGRLPLVKPVPLHALTPEAELARASLAAERVRNRRRAFSLGPLPPGASKRTKRKHLPLVVILAAPWERIDLAVLPGAVGVFARAAEAAGYIVAARASGDDAFEVGVAREVGGRPRLWMRARWSRIGASGQRLAGLTSRGVVLDGRVVPVTAARAALTR